MADEIIIRPGDLLATRSQSGFGSFMIRLGAALRNKPNLANHIAVVHHVDGTGTVWCYEGRPGGVGQEDATRYLASKWTMCNATQPKTDKQRKIITDGVVAMLGTPYDWQAIAQDAAAVIPGIDKVWELRWGKNKEVPGQVVCSSLAAWLYEKAGLAHPAGDREVDPAGFVGLWIERGWARRAYGAKVRGLH